MTIRALTNARVYSLSADAIGMVLKDQPEVTLGRAGESLGSCERCSSCLVTGIRRAVQAHEERGPHSLR
jgi:hypothetical protein